MKSSSVITSSILNVLTALKLPNGSAGFVGVGGVGLSCGAGCCQHVSALQQRRLLRFHGKNRRNDDRNTCWRRGGGRRARARREVRLWRNIPDLYTGQPKNIVLPSFVEPFWQSCIDRVEIVEGRNRKRICAVGTPGIGKTCATPLLLRMLLLKHTPVVYIRRSIDRSSCFYEIIPTSHNNKLDGKVAVSVNVYPEKSNTGCIPSLKATSNYFVVDPGTSNDSCDPETGFPARVIIISLPNEEHWIAGTFFKDHGRQTGLVRYYPLWNYSELLCGLDRLSSVVQISSQQLVERYRQVGGVPRHLLADAEEYQNILETQDTAIEAIEPAEALRIVSGNDVDPIGLLNGGVPKSAVIGIEAGDNQYGRFTVKKTVPVSTAVLEKLS